MRVIRNTLFNSIRLIPLLLFVPVSAEAGKGSDAAYLQSRMKHLSKAAQEKTREDAVGPAAEKALIGATGIQAPAKVDSEEEDDGDKDETGAPEPGAPAETVRPSAVSPKAPPPPAAKPARSGPQGPAKPGTAEPEIVFPGK